MPPGAGAWKRRWPASPVSRSPSVSSWYSGLPSRRTRPTGSRVCTSSVPWGEKAAATGWEGSSKLRSARAAHASPAPAASHARLPTSTRRLPRGDGREQRAILAEGEVAGQHAQRHLQVAPPRTRRGELEEGAVHHAIAAGGLAGLGLQSRIGRAPARGAQGQRGGGAELVQQREPALRVHHQPRRDARLEGHVRRGARRTGGEQRRGPHLLHHPALPIHPQQLGAAKAAHPQSVRGRHHVAQVRREPQRAPRGASCRGQGHERAVRAGHVQQVLRRAVGEPARGRAHRAPGALHPALHVQAQQRAARPREQVHSARPVLHQSARLVARLERHRGPHLPQGQVHQPHPVPVRVRRHGRAPVPGHQQRAAAHRGRRMHDAHRLLLRRRGRRRRLVLAGGEREQQRRERGPSCRRQRGGPRSSNRCGPAHPAPPACSRSAAPSS